MPDGRKSKNEKNYSKAILLRTEGSDGSNEDVWLPKFKQMQFIIIMNW